MSGLRSRAYVALGVLPWAILFAVVWSVRAAVRARKDPSLYTGTCYKPNGTAVRCSLDDWLLWDATPYLDIAIFAGAVLAAAVSGYVFLKYLVRSRRAP